MSGNYSLRLRHRLALRLRALQEKFRTSLFALPALWVVGAILFAEALMKVDSSIDPESAPWFLEFTVASARELLSAVITATVTVAGVVFALISLTVQLASTQYSPRAMRSFLRDRYQQSIMGYMVGVFAYSLMVLREVRVYEYDPPQKVPVPYSTGLAMVFAIGVVLAILAAVNRTAHSLQVSELVRSITNETTTTIAAVKEQRKGATHEQVPRPPGDAAVVSTTHQGWVQQVGAAHLLANLPPNVTLWVDVEPGTFVHRGARVGRTHALADVDKVVCAFDEAVVVGDVRTMQQDIGFGLRQIVDIALRALSPGINDPTTAAECIAHLRSALYRVLLLPDGQLVDHGEEGQRVVYTAQRDADAFMGLAWDEIRVAARPLPATLMTLVGALRDLRRDLEDAGDTSHGGLIDRHIGLILAEADQGDIIEADRERIIRAAVG